MTAKEEDSKASPRRQQVKQTAEQSSSTVCGGTGSYRGAPVWSCVGRALLGRRDGYRLSGALGTIFLCLAWPLRCLKSEQSDYNRCQCRVPHVNWQNPGAFLNTGVRRLCARVYFHSRRSEPFRVVTSSFPLLPQVRFAWQTISSFCSSPKGKWSFKLTGNQQSVGWLTPSSVSMWRDMELTSLRILGIIRMNLLLYLLLYFKYLQLFPYQMKSGRQWGLWGLRSRRSGCCWRWSQDQNMVQHHRWRNDLNTRKTRIGET